MFSVTQCMYAEDYVHSVELKINDRETTPGYQTKVN